jgi:DNA primase
MTLYLDDTIYKRYAELHKKMVNALHTTNDGKIALEYLENERKINKDLINKFQIGLCPENSKFSDSYNKLEPLKGRVIFPIKDEFNNIVALSGRYPRNIKGEDPWWHESYNKSFFLYGLNLALDGILKKKYAIIVEGQFDVIKCHKFGLTNTVGTMGTALTANHIVKLLRFTDKLILMLDGDEAGRKNTNRIKDEFKGYIDHGFLEIYDVPLIVGESPYDPDEYLNEFGANALKNKIIKIIKNRGKNVH